MVLVRLVEGSVCTCRCLALHIMMVEWLWKVPSWIARVRNEERSDLEVSSS
jgi:hypothetical protein